MKNLKTKLTAGGLILFSVIVVSVCVSIITNVVTGNLLSEYNEALQQHDNFTTLSLIKPSPLPGTYEESLSTIRDVSLHSMVLLQKKVVDNRGQKWITNSDSVATGVLVTNDGWIVLHSDMFLTEASLMTGYDIWVNNKKYEIERAIIDNEEDCIMIKISNDNFSAIEFGNSNNVSTGGILFVIENGLSIFQTTLDNSEILSADLISPAEKFIFEWQIRDDFSDSLPILNSSGALVGFTKSDFSAIPLRHIEKFVDSVIRGEDQNIAGLGAYVVDVDSVLNIPEDELFGYSNGSLIYPINNYTSAVVSDEPADLAGLKAGDLILSVNGALIKGSVTLADLLSGYSSGDKIVLQIVNENGNRDINIVLSNYKDLIY